MEKNNKIMFFIGSLNWGGAEKVISVLADSYLEKGYEVFVVTVLSNKNIYELDSRIKHISLARENKSNLRNVFYWIKGIKTLIKNVQPKTIVSFVCRINLLVIYAKMLSDVKCRLVISERNDPNHDTRGTLAKHLSKVLYPRADLLICQTTRQKDFFTKKIQQKTVVIPNPAFLTCDPIPYSEKKKIIINAARYDESKNQKLLINAFSKIIESKKDNGYELHLYGSGAYKAILKKHIDSLGLEKRVMLFDSIKNVQERISEASVFCLSSNYEGMSNSLMEALLLCTPSVSTDTSGARDLIDDGKNGFVVPVGDVDAMTNALTTLINEDKMREKMYLCCKSDEYRTRFLNSLDLYHKNIDNN